MGNNTNFTYTKVNIIDPMFNTTFGTMEIPTGWQYAPNIIWNFPNKNIVIYIMVIIITCTLLKEMMEQ